MTNKTKAEIDELHKILEDNLSKEVIDRWGGTFEKLMKNYHQSRLNAIAKEVKGLDRGTLTEIEHTTEAKRFSGRQVETEVVRLKEVLKIITKHTE